MIDYINEIIAAFDKEEPIWRGIKTRDAPEDMNKIDEDYEKLSPDKAKLFHNLVANTLYTTKWSRPDTCTSTALTKKRVR